ncbi:MAG: IS21/IS408/IS1162 family transposase [Pseudonocardiaceae bacterium]
MNEVSGVLRCWLAGDGLRTAAERAGVDRKTARRYVEAAQAAGLVREGGECQLSDELIGVVIAAVRPVRRSGHGAAWDSLLAHEQQIREWIEAGLQLTNAHGKLTRLGVVVPYRTLHRFGVERCGFGRRPSTVRVADGEPGVECQIDFARMGLINDPESGRRRVVHALIFTAVYSRHMFVWLTLRQTLDAVIAGCEAAWKFFGGIFKVLIPDNMSPVVADADPVNPRFTVGWLDYAQARGFGTDPARVRSPKDKPRVERIVQYVRGNFYAGEDFADLADAQHRVQAWCTATAGLRIHGTTAQRPAEHFATEEVGRPLPAPTGVYDVPIFATPKVARDLHIEVARGLYSVPAELVGQRVEVRADARLVKVFSRGQLVETHPRVKAGSRSTDPGDYPVGRAEYALRDVAILAAKAAAAGPAVGVYATRLLDTPLPWTRMRTVYRLLGLVRTYGSGPVEAACSRALELDVVDVVKIARMLEQALEREPVNVAAKVVGGPARFARDASEFGATR